MKSWWESPFIPAPLRRLGYRFITAIPKGAKVVAMCTHKDHVFVATEYRVYKIIDDKLVPLEIA